MPGSRPPWPYQANRADTTHFNRDFRPQLARGGNELWMFHSRRHERLTRPGDGYWDFRGEWPSDGRRILHCRAAVGANPVLRIVDRNGSNSRALSDGVEGQGADHPRWIP